MEGFIVNQGYGCSNPRGGTTIYDYGDRVNIRTRVEQIDHQSNWLLF